MKITFPTSYSGATFDLTDEMVIKRSRNIYDSGLMQLNHNSIYFETPHVYALGDDHIAMDYIDGAVSFAQYLNTCTRQQAEHICARIINYITNNFSNETIFIRPDVTTNKIDHIITRLHDYDDIAMAKDLASAFGKSPITIEVGDYHGDLTFSNILIKDGSPYLIDFLPGYAPTPWLDVVKLQQEVNLNWSNYFVSPMSTGNYFYALEILKPFLHTYMQGRYKDTLKLMEALNYLRILPYANDSYIIANNLRNNIKNIVR